MFSHPFHRWMVRLTTDATKSCIGWVLATDKPDWDAPPYILAIIHRYI